MYYEVWSKIEKELDQWEQNFRNLTAGLIAMTVEWSLIKVEQDWEYCIKEKSEYEMSTVKMNDFERIGKQANKSKE